MVWLQSCKPPHPHCQKNGMPGRNSGVDDSIMSCRLGDPASAPDCRQAHAAAKRIELQPGSKRTRPQTGSALQRKSGHRLRCSTIFVIPHKH